MYTIRRTSLQQEGNVLTGSQAGEIYQAKLDGIVHADHVELHSRMEVPGNTIHWTFRGVLSGNAISGTVDVGEYGAATWTAVKASGFARLMTLCSSSV